MQNFIKKNVNCNLFLGYALMKFEKFEEADESWVSGREDSNNSHN